MIISKKLINKNLKKLIINRPHKQYKSINILINDLIAELILKNNKDFYDR